jgi:hypothetical protein
MPHWTWNFFVTDGSKFNSTYRNVWCRADLAPILEAMKEDDQAALLRHEIDSVRDEKSLVNDGTVYMSQIFTRLKLTLFLAIKTLRASHAICSKPDNMLRHLRDKCPHVTPEVRQMALQELKATSANTNEAS